MPVSYKIEPAPYWSHAGANCHTAPCNMPQDRPSARPKKPPTSELRAFAELLDGHLRRGTRPGTSQCLPWTNREFAEKLEPLEANADGDNASENTVSNWCNARATPRSVAPIVQALFGGTDQEPHHSDCAILCAAYAAACAARRPTPAAESEPTSSDWEIVGAYVIHQGLIGFRLGRPPDNLPDRATLVSPLRLGHAEGVYRGKSTFLAVTSATLTISSGHYHPQPNSTFAERNPDHPHIKANGDEHVITGPQVNEVLFGNVLGLPDDHGQHLMVMEQNERAKEGPITATLATAAGNFRAFEPGRKMTPVKDAIIAAILRTSPLRKDGSGRIILATSTIRRRK